MRETRYRYVVGKVINTYGFKVIGEIGVFKGAMTEYLLETCPCIEEYWAIDPWVTYYREDGRLALENRKVTWEGAFQWVSSLMLKYKQLKIIRTTSSEAASIFPDGYFDLVFIDGDHDYEPVKNDITAWSKKMKQSGVLCGHDYCSNEPGVVKAVNETIGVGIAKRSQGMTWFAKDVGNCIVMKDTYNYDLFNVR